MMGKRPYQSKIRRDLKKEIISKQVIVKQQDVSSSWSAEAADFITKVYIIEMRSSVCREDLQVD